MPNYIEHITTTSQNSQPTTKKPHTMKIPRRYLHDSKRPSDTSFINLKLKPNITQLRKPALIKPVIRPSLNYILVNSSSKESALHPPFHPSAARYISLNYRLPLNKTSACFSYLSSCFSFFPLPNTHTYIHTSIKCTHKGRP